MVFKLNFSATYCTEPLKEPPQTVDGPFIVNGNATIIHTGSFHGKVCPNANEGEDLGTASAPVAFGDCSQVLI